MTDKKFDITPFELGSEIIIRPLRKISWYVRLWWRFRKLIRLPHKHPVYTVASIEHESSVIDVDRDIEEDCPKCAKTRAIAKRYRNRKAKDISIVSLESSKDAIIMKRRN